MSLAVQEEAAPSTQPSSASSSSSSLSESIMAGSQQVNLMHRWWSHCWDSHRRFGVCSDHYHHHCRRTESDVGYSIGSIISLCSCRNRRAEPTPQHEPVKMIDTVQMQPITQAPQASQPRPSQSITVCCVIDVSFPLMDQLDFGHEMSSEI